jgi:HAE1 family hydrophobic/amphiphilic exporter-1
MGTTVIGGMLAATCIAIFVIPVLFVTVEKLATKSEPITVAPLALGPDVDAKTT